MTDSSEKSGPEAATAGQRKLTPAAKRALAEAAERRRLRDREKTEEKEPPKELGGVDGAEPTRFGDWENKGIASDF